MNFCLIFKPVFIFSVDLMQIFAELDYVSNKIKKKVAETPIQ